VVELRIRDHVISTAERKLACCLVRVDDDVTLSGSTSQSLQAAVSTMLLMTSASVSIQSNSIKTMKRMANEVKITLKIVLSDQFHVGLHGLGGQRIAAERQMVVVCHVQGPASERKRNIFFLEKKNVDIFQHTHEHTNNKALSRSRTNKGHFSDC
jgi:hypothetical protein